MSDDGHGCDLVIGLGEIGRPLMSILSGSFVVFGRDIEPTALGARVNVLHICYPYEARDFVRTTASYIREYAPKFTIIHSTVVPGTTRQVSDTTGSPIAYSPMRGKHTRMQSDLLHYTKFVAGASPTVGQEAAKHLGKAGFRARVVARAESLELSKLIETTYFGVLLSWAQEVERYSRAVGGDYEDALALCSEVPYLPPVIFQPGYIGGHCVIPNTYLLERVRPSPFLDLIRSSNEIKKQEWLQDGHDLSERIGPKTISQLEDECLVPETSDR